MNLQKLIAVGVVVVLCLSLLGLAMVYYKPPVTTVCTITATSNADASGIGSVSFEKPVCVTQ